MSSKKASSAVRLQFNFPRETLASLDALLERQCIPTRAEAIRKALKLYEVVATRQQKGERLFVKEADGTLTEILLLI